MAAVQRWVYAPQLRLQKQQYQSLVHPPGKLSGITWINCYHPTFNEAPWGGYKQSGIGRELGTYGYDAYTEVKQITQCINPQPLGWFKNLG